MHLLGIVFFEVIDRDEDGLLEFNEVMNFYKGIVGVKAEDLYVVTKEGYRALTAVSYFCNLEWRVLRNMIRYLSKTSFYFQ